MKRSRILIIALGTSIAALGAPAMASDSSGTAAIQARTGTVSLDYVNADVTDVIRALAAQSKINVAMNPSVRGQITIHLRNKPVNEALSVVTNLAGLGFKKVNDTYVIAPRTEMRATLERLGVKRTVQPSRLSAQQAADLAGNAFPDVTARVQGNQVVLAGAPEDIDGAEALIRENDSATPDASRVSERIAVRNRPASQVAATLIKLHPNLTVEVLGDAILVGGTKADIQQIKADVELLDISARSDVETRVYHVRYAPPAQLVTLLERASPDVIVTLGPDSNTPPVITFSPLSSQFVGGTPGSSGGASGGSPGGASGGSPAGAPGGQPVGGVPGALRRALTLVLKGPRAALDEAFSILALTDTAPKQMLIEARVVDASPDFTQNLGVQWSWNPFQFGERPGLGQTGPASVPNGTALPLGPLGFGSFGRTQFTPTAILNAITTDNRSKLLASPQIAVIDDQDASIFIGDTLRFQSLAQSSPTTGNQFTVVEVPVGIILLVHPRVNENGVITLRVHPVVSTVTGFTDGLPQTSSREAETVIRVKDGDTIVIGGLIRDEDVRQMSKVPLLGDLPLIGYLFRNDLHTKRRSEVTVFLTIKMLPS